MGKSTLTQVGPRFIGAIVENLPFGGAAGATQRGKLKVFTGMAAGIGKTYRC